MAMPMTGGTLSPDAFQQMMAGRPQQAPSIEPLPGYFRRFGFANQAQGLWNIIHGQPGGPYAPPGMQGGMQRTGFPTPGAGGIISPEQMAAWHAGGAQGNPADAQRQALAALMGIGQQIRSKSQNLVGRGGRSGGGPGGISGPGRAGGGLY